MKRLFIAAPIKANQQLNEIRVKLITSLQNEAIAWTNFEQIHITFKFIGETPKSKIDSIIKSLETSTQNTKALDITLKHIGIFGSSYNPKVIWAGIEEKKETLNIYNQIQQELTKIQIFSTRENFVPHITLGRIKKPIQKHFFQNTINQWDNVFLGNSKIDSIVLFESILRPNGAVHKPLKTIKLKHE